jgi:transcription antitermination factor NusG
MRIEEPPSINSSKNAWYAIYTKHQHEKSAADILTRKGFDILLPLYRLIRRWKDRDKSVLSPLFPCYLFVRTDLSRKVDILRTPGVFWLVESGGCACQIPDADVDEINKIVRSPAHITPHPYLKSGEWVRVRHGSLEGLEGILTRFKNQYRVVVTVEPLRKSVAVEVDISSIEPLPGNDPKSIYTTFPLAAQAETPKRAPLSRAAAAGTSPSSHS